MAAVLRAGCSWDYGEVLMLNYQDKGLINGEGESPLQVTVGDNSIAIMPHLTFAGKSVVFCTIVDPKSDLHKAATPL